MNDYSSQHYVHCVHSCIYLIYISVRDMTRWCWEKTDLCMWKTWTLQHSAPPFLARLTPGGHLENKKKRQRKMRERQQSGIQHTNRRYNKSASHVPATEITPNHRRHKKLSLQAGEMRGYRETSISPLPITSIRLASLEHPAPTKRVRKRKGHKTDKALICLSFLYLYVDCSCIAFQSQGGTHWEWTAPTCCIIYLYELSVLF